MRGVEELPAAVRRRVHAHCGEFAEAELLSGMSAGRVFRLRGERGAIVVKRSLYPLEAAFYERVAPQLRRCGVPIPSLVGSIVEGDVRWLLLEAIPEPLPRLPGNPVQPDDRALAVLVRLHAATRGWVLDLPAPPAAVWTERVTDSAASCFPSPVAAEITALLRPMQRCAQRLDEPWCWISGDPNPTNWGMSADGGAVLFDWERFRAGMPATDLAITIAGLGDRQQYAELAERYRTAWRPTGGDLPWPAERLAAQIALAKVASVVGFLSMYREGAVHAREGLIPWLLDAVPAWLGHLRDAAG